MKIAVMKAIADLSYPFIASHIAFLFTSYSTYDTDLTFLARKLENSHSDLRIELGVAGGNFDFQLSHFNYAVS